MTNPYRKFQGKKHKIGDLEQNNERFRRIYSEFETLSDELWNLETSENLNISDDFINSVKLQRFYLEQEIEDWLLDSTEKEK